MLLKDLARRAAPAPAFVLLAALTACGGGSSESTASSEPSAASSPSTDESPTSESTPVAEPGSKGDGTCGGGELETQQLKVPRDATLTVPADWETATDNGGVATGLYPPDRDAGDGYLTQENWVLSLDEAVKEKLDSTAKAAEKTSDAPLQLKGFEESRMVTFAYDEETFSVYVLATTGDALFVANMTREGVPQEQAVAESCLSSLTRTP